MLVLFLVIKIEDLVAYHLKFQGYLKHSYDITPLIFLYAIMFLSFTNVFKRVCGEINVVLTHNQMK